MQIEGRPSRQPWLSLKDRWERSQGNEKTKAQPWSKAKIRAAIKKTTLQNTEGNQNQGSAERKSRSDICGDNLADGAYAQAIIHFDF